MTASSNQFPLNEKRKDDADSEKRSVDADVEKHKTDASSDASANPQSDASSRLQQNTHFLAWCVFNRDLSHLEFLRRVLEQALDESQPLLERLKFLSIFSSNLDEFFMVRVSGLKEMLEEEASIGMMPGELKPSEQLKIIRERL